MKVRTTLLALALLFGPALAERPSKAAGHVHTLAGTGVATTVPGSAGARKDPPTADAALDPAQSRCLPGSPVARRPGAAVLAAVSPVAEVAEGAQDRAPATGAGVAAAPVAAAIDGLAQAAPIAASGDDDLGTRSRRLPGFPHPLPLPRADDAAMRVALARALRPGMNPPDMDALPATLIGQMLMVGFEGDDVDQPGPRRLAAHIRAGNVGGLIFFRRNIASEDAVRRLTAMFHAAAATSPAARSVFVAVDQEGGLVQRLDSRVGFAETPSAAAVAARGEAVAATTYRRLARHLADWGFNLNLGPVVDLGFNDDNPVVTRLGRAFAPDPATVTRFAELFIAAHRAAGVLTAVKHFPGHGSSNGDTHDGFVDVTDSFRPEEMLPFEQLIAAQAADMIMVGHVENGGLDPLLRPASLSPVVIEEVLRERCGFTGVVISDDLEMGAIRARGPPFAVAREAILAGNDILVYGSGQTPEGDLVAVLHAQIRIAAEDPAVLARIGESYDRIGRLKATLPR